MIATGASGTGSCGCWQCEQCKERLLGLGLLDNCCPEDN